MLFNHLSRTSPTQLQLHTISPFLMSLLGIIQLVCWIVGAFLILSLLLDIMGWDWGSLGSHPGWVLAGVILVMSGNVLMMVNDLFAQIGITWIFDGKHQVVQLNSKSKHVLRYFSKPIPFAQIRMFRLKHMLRHPETRAKEWLLEMVTDNHTFYPVTMFRSESKARALLKEIQQWLSVPLIEEPVRDHTFRAYKDAFIAQFEHSEPAVAPSPANHTD